VSKYQLRFLLSNQDRSPDLPVNEFPNRSCPSHGTESDPHPAVPASRFLHRQAALLQWITLAWMAVEGAASLYAAARAHSLALVVFGSDSLIELFSAIVVLLQFLPYFPLSEQKAERGVAVLLFALAAVVTGTALLAHQSVIESSPLGIAITAIALVAMPVLARMKRRLARKLDNAALAADATQSAACAYLAAVTLAGLAIFAIWHIRWVDSVAALAAVPILVVEGRRAWRGQSCGCGRATNVNSRC